MASVEKKTKLVAERRLKNPVAYSRVVRVDTTAPDEQTLLALIKELDISAKASKHVEDVLYMRIGQFRQQLGYLLGLYRARAHARGLLPTLKSQRIYARRLEKHVARAGRLPEEPQYVPPMVRYNRAVIDGADPLDVVKQYVREVEEVKGERGQPPNPDKDRLICDILALITNYGIDATEARQYTELVLKTSGVEVPNIGDDDGRALRFIQDRERKRRGQ